MKRLFRSFTPSKNDFHSLPGLKSKVAFYLMSNSFQMELWIIFDLCLCAINNEQKLQLVHFNAFF